MGIFTGAGGIISGEETDGDSEGDGEGENDGDNNDDIEGESDGETRGSGDEAIDEDDDGSEAFLLASKPFVTCCNILRKALSPGWTLFLTYRIEATLKQKNFCITNVYEHYSANEPTPHVQVC